MSVEDLMNQTTRKIPCTHVIGRNGPRPGAQTVIIDNGRIASIEAASFMTVPLLALPALVNAHDHGRAIRTSSIGADATERILC